MKHFSKRAVAPISQAPGTAIDPTGGQRQRALKSRNKANTIRNWAKVENYLMEVEKVHGFAKSWALRERLEQGDVSLDELMGR